MNSYSIRRNDIFSGTTPFLTSYDWNIKFLDGPTIFSLNGNSEEALVDKVLNTTYLLRTVSWSAPDIPDANIQTINIKGHQFTQPGLAPNYGSVAMQIQDNSDLTITKYFTYLEKAMDSPRTHSTAGRNPRTLKFNFNIYRLDPMGNPVQMWACRDSFVNNVAMDVMGSSDKSIIGTVRVQYLVNYYEIFFKDDPDWSAWDKGAEGSSN